MVPRHLNTIAKVDISDSEEGRLNELWQFRPILGDVPKGLVLSSHLKAGLLYLVAVLVA
jgi:hypothetical protein